MSWFKRKYKTEELLAAEVALKRSKANRLEHMEQAAQTLYKNIVSRINQCIERGETSLNADIDLLFMRNNLSFVSEDQILIISKIKERIEKKGYTFIMHIDESPFGVKSANGEIRIKWEDNNNE